MNKTNKKAPRSSSKKHDTYTCPNKLNILSWNIGDSSDKILGVKSSNPDFVDVISNSDIFCLQETKGELKIPDYRCFNVLRTDSRSGGLCLGIRQHLAQHIKIMDTSKYSQDIQAAKISRALTGNDRDTYIINVYDSPANSSYKLKRRNLSNYKDTLVLLNDFIASLPSNSDTILLGDFNARTGSDNSLTMDNGIILRNLSDGSFSRESHPCKTDRNSMDIISNERGKKLLDLATEWNLSVLNGSTVGDVRGNWTCLKYNGFSVIDYILVSHRMRTNINTMSVMEFNDFSDHKPISCLLNACHQSSNIGKISSASLEDKPLGFRWRTNNEESKLRYLQKQNDEDIKEKFVELSNRVCLNQDDVYNINTSLVDVIIETASGALERKRIPKKRTSFKNAW